MSTRDPKFVLHTYLQRERDAMMWKLDGLSEYDVRRPLLPTGTNLLGLVKHVASVSSGYLGDVFDRPFGEPLPWLGEDAEPNADLWVPATEARDDIIGLWERAWSHADATIEALPLDAVGRVPWWPEDRREITLLHALVHVTTEVARHAGHADAVRELIDGTAGLRESSDNLWEPADGWAGMRGRIEADAATFRG